LHFLCKKEKLPFAALRLSQIYDEKRACEKHQPFLYFMIDKILKDNEITFFGAEDVLRNYIHIDDVTGAIEKFVMSEKQGIFNVICSKTYKISGIAGIISKDVKINFDSSKEGLKKYFIPPKDSKNCIYGKISLEEGIGLIKKVMEGGDV
jgi:nucleoside-diphosphate-sugar epimerase